MSIRVKVMISSFTLYASVAEERLQETDRAPIRSVSFKFGISQSTFFNNLIILNIEYVEYLLFTIIINDCI